MQAFAIVFILLAFGSQNSFIISHVSPIVYIQETMSGEPLLAAIPHAPIEIDGDYNFNATAQAEGWYGNGTKFNPYIIEDLEIDQGGGPGHCISIMNTRVYFIIQSCNLYLGNSGIDLINVTNGQFMNNHCSYNSYGIRLQNSDNNTLSNNTCSDNTWYGISLTNSDANALADNTCIATSSGPGILLESSSERNLAANNTCSYNDLFGFWIKSSNHNMLYNNTCISNEVGIWLEGSDYNLIEDSIINSNSFTGIYCYVGISNTISNNTCMYQGIGIYFEESSYSIVTSNKIVSNSEGIWLFGTAISNAITNNTCSDNSIAVELDSYTENNDILWNIFESISGWNCYDDGINNTFDHNYWSDYDGIDENLDGIGDYPYQINGTMGGVRNQDLNPLIFPLGRLPLVWLEQPTDRLLVWNENFYYDLNVTAYGGVNLWWLNDTSNFHIDQNGIIRNSTCVAPGIFGIQVSVNDSYSNSLTGIFCVTVIDTTPPQWSQLPTNQILECGERLCIDLNATDILLDSWWLNDTAQFMIDNEGLLTSIGIIPVGIYGVQVWVNDTSSNTISAIFTVSVIDTKPPVWIETPKNQTIAYGTDYVCDFNATDPSGIADWWIDDTVHFTIDWTGRVRTVGILELGIYGLRIYVNDVYGHVLWVAILIEVTAATGPNTTTTTAISNSTVALDGTNPIITFILGLEVGGGISIIIAFALLRRRVIELDANHKSS